MLILHLIVDTTLRSLVADVLTFNSTLTCTDSELVATASASSASAISSLNALTANGGQQPRLWQLDGLAFLSSCSPRSAAASLAFLPPDSLGGHHLARSASMASHVYTSSLAYSSPTSQAAANGSASASPARSATAASRGTHHLDSGAFSALRRQRLQQPVASTGGCLASSTPRGATAASPNFTTRPTAAARPRAPAAASLTARPTATALSTLSRRAAALCAHFTGDEPRTLARLDQPGQFDTARSQARHASPSQARHASRPPAQPAAAVPEQPDAVSQRTAGQRARQGNRAAHSTQRSLASLNAPQRRRSFRSGAHSLQPLTSTGGRLARRLPGRRLARSTTRSFGTTAARTAASQPPAMRRRQPSPLPPARPFLFGLALLLLYGTPCSSASATRGPHLAEPHPLADLASVLPQRAPPLEHGRA